MEAYDENKFKNYKQIGLLLLLSILNTLSRPFFARYFPLPLRERVAAQLTGEGFFKEINHY